MTTPSFIKSDNVSFASCSQDVTRLSKSVKESMRSPLNVFASKSTNFETVVTVETGSYQGERDMLCRLKPTAKNSSPFSPLLVVLTFQRLRLVLQTRRSLAPVVVALLHLSPFLSLQLAIVGVPAVSPELVAQLQLLRLRHFVLSRSTHSCQRGSAACPSSFNSFGTSAPSALPR